MTGKQGGMEDGALLESAPCPLCGTTEFAVLEPAAYPPGLTRDRILAIYSASSATVLLDQLVRCSSCDLIHLTPRIRQDLILESYANAVDPAFIAQNPLRIRTFRRQLRRLADRHGLPAGARVLDVGCAGGAFPKAAADLGFRVVGVEPSRWLAQQAAQTYGLDIRPGILEEQQFTPASFDMITLWDVIEHLTDPQGVLRQIHSLLAPSGLLVVNYPDHASLARRLLGDRWPFFLSVHLIYFTPVTLDRMLQINGFRVLEQRPYWQTLELGYALQRAAAGLRAFSFLGQGISLLGLDRLPLTYTMGQTLAVARKPS
ncbi:MAG: class I SAM-dependent methyltransferase [Magnetococcales bacterium]|nr:class I SAM-dependent methyltransferase [Magnetococcales bacterium]